MGIDVRCPNGHHTRLKDRFAGKKVRCPKCNASFRVPAAASSDSTPVARVVSLDATYAAGLPRALAKPPAAPDPAPAAKKAAVAKPAPARPAPVAAEAPPPPAARPLHPVIAEAVDAMWSVALPGGDPSEAISGGDLQEWLESGEATGDEIVWRADWPDWVAIRLVFPEHMPAGDV